MTKRRLASINLVWLAVPWVGIVSATKRPIRDSSFLWHVEAGRLQLETGQVLSSDPFSSAFLGEPWRTQSWLLELIYAQLGAGLKWVGPYIALMAFVLLVSVGIAIYQQTRSARITGGLVIGLELLALPYLVPRPVVVSFALLALLALSVRTTRLRWAIPLILWVWASVHGSFVLGGGLLVLDGLARRDRTRIKDVIASLVTVSLTAHGWHVWGVLWTFLKSRDSLGAITEWAPPNILELQVLPFTIVVVALLIAATHGRLSTRSMWVIVPFLVFGLSSVRALLPAAIVMVVWMASAFRGIERPRVDQGSLVATLVVVAILVGPFAVRREGGSQIDPKVFPVEAVGHLQPELTTFHDDAVGGYLIYRGLTPVMLDDRAELYPIDFIESVLASRTGAIEWRSTFDDLGVTQMVARRTDGIAKALVEEPDWEEVYQDAEFVVWRKKA